MQPKHASAKISQTSNIPNPKQIQHKLSMMITSLQLISHPKVEA